MIIWDGETKTVAQLRGQHALALLAQLRSNTEWVQQGCVVGEPVWRLSLDNPDDKGKPVLTNQIVLSPKQTAVLFDALVQKESTLQRMAKEEVEEEARRLGQVYGILLRAGARNKHNF